MRYLSLLLLIAGCAVPSSTPSQTTDSAGAGRPDFEDADRLLHLEVNRARADLGVDALQWSEPLAEVALAHSQDMARRGYFAHESPEGSTPSDRAIKGGIDCRVETSDGRYRVGVSENLYVTTAYESIRKRRRGTVVEQDIDWFSPDEVARRTVQAWLDSPGHRRNLLDDVPSTHGIGVAMSDDDRINITQVLC